MKLIRKFAVQGHAVPNGAQAALGPFPPELYARTRVDYGDAPESLPETYDDTRMFLCKLCGDVVREEGLSSHVCEDEV
jgi:hypothetical protein